MPELFQKKSRYAMGPSSSKRIGELIINSYPLYSRGSEERFFDTDIGSGSKRGIRERELVAGLYFMEANNYSMEQFARAVQLSETRLQYIIAQAEFDPMYQAFRDSILYNAEVRDRFRAEYLSFDKLGEKIGWQDTFLKVDNPDVPDNEIGRKRLMAAYYLSTYEDKSTVNVADALNMQEETLLSLWDQYMNESWFMDFRSAPEEWALNEGLKDTNYLRSRCFKVLERANINTVSEDERIRALRYHPDNLRGIDRNLYTPERYHEYCRIAVRANGLALEHTPDEIKAKDREMCLDGVREFGAALKHIPVFMRDREICKTAVASFGYALWYVPPRIKDRDICWIAVMHDGRAIQFAPKNLISEDLFKRSDADFKELYRPHRFAPDDAKLNRMRRAELSKNITGIAVRNLPKKAPVFQPTDVNPADYYYNVRNLTPAQKKEVEIHWSETYAPQIAAFANRAIEFRMGNLSAKEFLKQPPFSYSDSEMTESWAFREAVTVSEFWVQKYPEKMRIFLMPKPYFITKTSLNVPLLTLKQCKEANPYEIPFRMNNAGKAAFIILETYHAELAIAYRTGLMSAEEYFNTPPAPYMGQFKSVAERKAAADQSTAYYANLFRKEIEERLAGSRKTDVRGEVDKVSNYMKR